MEIAIILYVLGALFVSFTMSQMSPGHFWECLFTGVVWPLYVAVMVLIMAGYALKLWFTREI